MSGRRVVTEAEVRAAARTGGGLDVPAGAIVTPAAQDLARTLGVSLGVPVASADTAPSVAAPPPAGAGERTPARAVVAIGADHGGFPLKEQLKGAVAELGYEVLDLGTHDTQAVDYPDFAVAVARAVADGRAWRGIMIDGAGIGSAMAANKVAGVRAALCYDLTTAQNAREHNDANLLTLGGTLIGTRLAVDIVRAFLATLFGGGRHAKRVDKINSLDSARDQPSTRDGRGG
ncbi:MAG TPA: ribose 5-phosphate isomerase B [Gemmatimonadales bacterium]|nr:ribose 5-phosphate isomerase B [Gemmatimonadales bacterium]